MKIFEITPKIKVVCDWVKTRSAFKHTATLMIDGSEVESTKICYQNRTWERYEFQSVLQKVINDSKFLSDDEKTLCLKFAEGDHTDWDGMKMVGAIAQLGELLCTDKKEKNDWKLRMIKAGLENKGLSVPDDWDDLSEDEKEKRLNKITEHLNGLGENK